MLMKSTPGYEYEWKSCNNVQLQKGKGSPRYKASKKVQTENDFSVQNKSQEKKWVRIPYPGRVSNCYTLWMYGQNVSLDVLKPGADALDISGLLV